MKKPTPTPTIDERGRAVDASAAEATGHATGCDCTTCCLVRTEAWRVDGLGYVAGCARRSNKEG